MRLLAPWTVVTALVLLAPFVGAQQPNPVGAGTFNGTPVHVAAYGNPAAPPPRVRASGVTAEEVEQGAYDPGDTLELLSASRWTGQQNLAAFSLFDEGPRDRVTARFKLRVGAGGLGGSFLLLPTEVFGDAGTPDAKLFSDGFSFDEPNLPGTLAIALDTHNPPTANWFNAAGNLYDRPQREVSVHFDGREVANALSPVEYRSALVPQDDREGFHDVQIDCVHAVGGGFVTVTIDERPVIDKLFVAGLFPYESRLAFGACSSDHTGAFDVRALSSDAGVVYEDGFEERTTATPFRRAVFNGATRRHTSQLVLPDVAQTDIGRIVLTLTLDPGPGGCDPWDKRGALYAYGDAGGRYEILRFFTPFGRPVRWQVDVTDYAPLLRGRCGFEMFIDTETAGQTPETTPGWTVTATLDYYRGEPERRVVGIGKLWVGEPEYGDPANPMDNFFDPREVQLPDGADSAIVRMIVTGHGTSPATYNAGEFMPADRTLVINDEHAEPNRLWRQDAYLNPCRPQGGTWKFDRAGWAPGAVVRPWDVDLSGRFDELGRCRLRYIPMAYENLARDQAKATHWVEAQVFYLDTRP